MSEKPKRLYGLGWIEVRDLRSMDEEYKGTSLLNLDQFARIKMPDEGKRRGVDILYYPDGRSEALEDENCSRLLQAIKDAKLE
jgi:hypothetical protein